MGKACMSGLVLLLLAAGTVTAEERKALQTEDQKLSYAMGLDLGEYFKGLDEAFDLDMLQEGIKDGYKGNPPQLSAEEAASIQQNFAKRQQEKQIKKTVAMIEKNRKAATDFLAENKKKKGVMETASGLQYKVVKKGQGKTPGATDMVKVHYTGSLLDGKEFDSSYKRNEPAVFQVNQVIDGWKEILPLMPEGSSYEVYIPPDLAYGDRGAPPEIEPGSMLIFKVDLLEVMPPDAVDNANKDSGGKAE